MLCSLVVGSWSAVGGEIWLVNDCCFVPENNDGALERFNGSKGEVWSMDHKIAMTKKNETRKKQELYGELFRDIEKLFGVK